MRERRGSVFQIDVLWFWSLMPARGTRPPGCVRQIQMRQPHLDLAIALRYIPHAEQVNDRRSGRRSRQLWIKSTHGHDDAHESPETQAAQPAVLEPANGRLGETTAAAQLPLGPAEDRSPPFDHGADKLPAALDLRMSFAS